MRTPTTAILALVLSLLPSLPSGCATTPGPDGGTRIIEVGKDCAVQAGREVAGQAILEVETAVAQATPAAALGLLEAVGLKYGIAFVSCAVSQIIGESKANLARAGDAGSQLDAVKVVNGQLWLSEHPVPK
jgi:hypothetical protein